MGELDGITTIVTGGAHGIGAGIVDVISGHGAQVAIADLDEDGACAVARSVLDRGGTAFGLGHDVTSKASCSDVVKRTRQEFGPVDALINNAGVTEKIPFQDLDEQAWDRVLNVNLKGVYLMTRTVIAEMIERRSGTVVNIASVLGKTGFDPSWRAGPYHEFFSHYIASKFGVIGLTQAVASEMAQYGIRVNAVCPGVVRTSMQEEGLREAAVEQGASAEQVWAEIVASVPLNRPQTPEDIGMAVAFLISNRARSITGESINVNGGQLMD